MSNYWLLKSEPTCFSIDDLQKAENQQTYWDGVRNYQARNFLKSMQLGDQVFFYHSNCPVPGIIGVAEVVQEAYPDFTALDPESEHPDPKSTVENPRWFMVDIRFQKKFPAIISLEKLKSCPELEELQLLRRGNRLSVLPIPRAQWNFIMSLTQSL